MKIKIKNKITVEEEVDVQLPLYWKFDQQCYKIEETYWIKNSFAIEAIQLTSVTSNCISRTLMTLDQFEAYYGHYKGLYDEITEQEFVAEFDKLNNYLR